MSFGSKPAKVSPQVSETYNHGQERTDMFLFMYWQRSTRIFCFLFFLQQRSLEFGACSFHHLVSYLIAGSFHSCPFCFLFYVSSSRFTIHKYGCLQYSMHVFVCRITRYVLEIIRLQHNLLLHKCMYRIT